MYKKEQYITPLCEIIAISHERSLMLTLSVFDEETEIVGAKEENDWDWNQEEGIFGIDTPKSNDVWANDNSEDQMK